MVKVEVRSRIVGAQSDHIPPNIVLELLNETVKVGDLIAGTVEEQIRDLLVTRKMDIDRAQRILERQYLTDEDIREQAAHGFVHTPTQQESHPLDVNIPREVAKAQQAFEKKTYLIVVDGYQPDTLDEELQLTSTSKVTFLRMTPLVGG